MIKAGATIENPVTGDRIVFLETARETDGELLRFDNFHRAGGIGPPPHVHPLQEERFTVKTGTFGVLVGGEERSLRIGESVALPPGTPHSWWNAGDDELLIEAELRPALHFAEIIETIFALGQTGGMSAKGTPDPLQLARTFMGYPGEHHLARPPVVARKAMNRVLGFLGRVRGYPPLCPCPYDRD